MSLQKLQLVLYYNIQSPIHHNLSVASALPEEADETERLFEKEAD